MMKNFTFLELEEDTAAFISKIYQHLTTEMLFMMHPVTGFLSVG
jgi:hypothetical protein